MAIREFQEKDNTQVKELVDTILYKEFPMSRKAYSIDDLDAITRAYGGSRDIFYVAEDSGKIVGTVGIKEDTKTIALLRRIYVHPNCRGKGYGSGLLAEAIQFCKKKGYTQIVFRSTDQMRDAIRLCEKKGFSEQERLNLGDIQILKFILRI